MNNWHLISQNGWLRSVASCYSSEFPMEVRALMAPWLEQNQSALSFDADNPGHHDAIRGFVWQMILQLKPEIEKLPAHDVPSYLYKTRLEEIASNIQILVAEDCLSMFRAVKQCLLMENQELQRLQYQAYGNSQASTHLSQTAMDNNPRKPFELLDEKITSDLGQAKLQCAIMVSNIREIHSKTADLQTLLYQMQQIQGPNHVYDPQVESSRASIEKLQTEIPQLRQQTCQLFSHVLQIIERVHPQVMEELANFKDEQRFIALGKESERNLPTIEKWFGGIYECMCSFENSLNGFQGLISHLSPNNAVWIQTAQDKITNFRKAMIANCLVIEEQPSQIIRKDTKFGPVKLRVLISSAIIDKEGFDAIFINEEDMRKLYANPEETVYSKSIITEKTNLQIIRNKAEFKNIRVSKSQIVRNAKRGQKTVTEEKFSIYFKIRVNISGHPPTQLRITTLPISVTTHPNQEGYAWATVLWDNAFSARNRLPFEVPEEVSWAALIEAINWRFISLSSEVRHGLTKENKEYLKDKLFGNVTPVREMVSWKQFCKDPYLQITPKPDHGDEDTSKAKKNITFWEWLYSCWKLLSGTPDDPKLAVADQSLRNLWGEGKIYGFISEENMRILLKTVNERQAGTFMLRFPEKRPESIGIYYYNHSDKNPKTALVKLHPYSIKHLREKPLQDRILNNKLVDFLYPNIDKKLAFKKTSARDLTTIDGYVRIEVKEEFTKDLLEKLKQGYTEQQNANAANCLFLPYSSPSFSLSPSTSITSDFTGRTRNSSAEDQSVSGLMDDGVCSQNQSDENSQNANEEWNHNTVLFDF